MAKQSGSSGLIQTYWPIHHKLFPPWGFAEEMNSTFQRLNYIMMGFTGVECYACLQTALEILILGFLIFGRNSYGSHLGNDKVPSHSTLLCLIDIYL